MPTTTVEAIRDNMVTLIEALSPNSLGSRKFRVDRAVDDFSSWAEEHANSCFRRFAVKDVTDYDPPEVSNHDEERLRARLEVMVAYPRQMPSTAGRDAKRDLYDVMREDLHQIDTAIGHRGQANYVSGQGGTVADTKQFFEGESVIMAVLELETYFHRSM